MASFSIGQAITTTEPTITVDAVLPVGDHVFQLEVVDDSGNRSQPDHVIVTIQPQTALHLQTNPVSQVQQPKAQTVVQPNVRLATPGIVTPPLPQPNK